MPGIGMRAIIQAYRDFKGILAYYPLIKKEISIMADYLINVFLDDEKMKKLEAAGLGGKVINLGGKKAVQVEMSAKEQKKLVKGFPDLTFDASNACTLPDEASAKLLGIIADMKTLDVMKFAIMKLYNPLAGKAPRSAMR
jgi:hypothetical protein